MLGKVSGALNHDFCPWANRYVYWLKKPIGWVILAFLSSILLGLYVSPQAFLASAGIASVAIIGSLWPWISMLGIRGQLSWNATRCQELESIQTTLVIANRWPWPAYGLSLDLDPGLAPEGFDKQRISLQKIPGFAKSTFTWSTVPQRRGQYPRQEVHLQTAFPFGIWNSSQPIAVPEPLIVWPRSTRLIDSPTQIASQQFGTGSLSDRVGDEGDWTGVRPYRPGDSLRQVHWAQTARRDALVVFERQAGASQSVLIGLDVQKARSASPQTLDAMLRILTSLVKQFHLHHWSVYIDLDGRHEISGIAERFVPSHRQRFLDRLALWSPDASNDEADLQVPRASQKIKPNIAVTISWNQRDQVESHVEGSSESRCLYRFEVIPDVPLGMVWDDQLQAVWQSFCRCQNGVLGNADTRAEFLAHATGRI